MKKSNYLFYKPFLHKNCRLQTPPHEILKKLIIGNKYEQFAGLFEMIFSRLNFFQKNIEIQVVWIPYSYWRWIKFDWSWIIICHHILSNLLFFNNLNQNKLKIESVGVILNSHLMEVQIISLFYLFESLKQIIF